MSTRAMIDAFCSDDRERKLWWYCLRQIENAVGCPCTTTTHVTPRVRSAATAGFYFPYPEFVPGRPVDRCGLCRGLGVDARGWTDPIPAREEATRES